MIEPVYVLENGQKIPYVPIEIKNHREAYAATLHVLFKHVADFHTCIVQTFSKKYGIPEDEIMQTIQESEEFKNMRVDPVLHHDTLGYISLPQQEPVPQQEIVPVPQQEPVPQPNETIAKKRIVKKKGPVITASEPTPEITAPAITAPAIISSEPPTTIVEKKKVIRKKVLPPPPTTTATTTTATTTTTTTTALDRNDTPNPTPPIHPCDDLVQILIKEPMTPKKIIRKKS